MSTTYSHVIQGKGEMSMCVCVHVCLCVCMYTCVHGDTEKKSKPEKENYGKMLTFDETGQGY